MAPQKRELALTTSERLEKRGREEGIEKGLKEGKHQGKIESAKNLFENGVSIEIIASSTGLSKEQLKKHGVK